MSLIGIIYSIGLVFTVILNQFFMVNPYNIIIMWLILFLIIILTVIGSVVGAHRRTAKLLNYSENMKHSKNISLFLITFVFGTILFILPVTLMPAQAELWILFSIGGILMLIYVMIGVIFGYSYHAVGVAALLIWIVFLIGSISLSNIYYQNAPMFASLAFLMTSITIITVFSITGVFMLYRASTEFLAEFKKINKIKI